MLCVQKESYINYPVNFRLNSVSDIVLLLQVCYASWIPSNGLLALQASGAVYLVQRTFELSEELNGVFCSVK